MAPRLVLGFAALLLLTLFATSASATLFAGSSKVQLEHSDEGVITASARHEYDEWLRTYELRIDFSRIGVYELSRVDSSEVSAFFGQGEEYREATGTLHVTLDDQGVESSLDCTLTLSETKPASASLLEYEGEMVVLAGNGWMDADAWECEYGGNEIVHSGADNVPLSSYAFAGVEGLVAGTFPAELAVMLGFADDEEEWADEIERGDLASAVVKSGYVEAQAKTGEQSIPFARQYDAEGDGDELRWILCGEIGVTETPATTYACAIDGKVTLDVSTGGATGSVPKPSASTGSTSPGSTSSRTPGSTGKDGGADTPAPAAFAVLACLAVAALALRRRGPA